MAATQTLTSIDLHVTYLSEQVEEKLEIYRRQNKRGYKVICHMKLLNEKSCNWQRGEARNITFQLFNRSDFIVNVSPKSKTRTSNSWKECSKHVMRPLPIFFT